MWCEWGLQLRTKSVSYGKIQSFRSAIFSVHVLSKYFQLKMGKEPKNEDFFCFFGGEWIKYSHIWRRYSVARLSASAEDPTCVWQTYDLSKTSDTSAPDSTAPRTNTAQICSGLCGLQWGSSPLSTAPDYRLPKRGQVYWRNGRKTTWNPNGRNNNPRQFNQGRNFFFYYARQAEAQAGRLSHEVRSACHILCARNQNLALLTTKIVLRWAND